MNKKHWKPQPIEELNLPMTNTNSKNPPEVNCPHCSKKIQWQQDNPFRPFCSERCKLIDLGRWANESHRIPGRQINEVMNKDSDEIKNGDDEE